MVDVHQEYLQPKIEHAKAADSDRSVKSKPTVAHHTATLGLTSSVHALPRVTVAPQYEREYLLGDVTTWSRYDVVVINKHPGVVRELFGQTLRTASVCDRPTILEPSTNCHHIIGNTTHFMVVYPHVPRLVLGHPFV